MPEFLVSHQNIIDSLREANPHRYKLACDLVEQSIILEHSQFVVDALALKFSQRYNINPNIAKTYIECAMWAYINNYFFDKITCKACNDTGYVQVAPNARGIKKCPTCSIPITT